MKEENQQLRSRLESLEARLESAEMLLRQLQARNWTGCEGEEERGANTSIWSRMQCSLLGHDYVHIRDEVYVSPNGVIYIDLVVPTYRCKRCGREKAGKPTEVTLEVG